MRVMTFNLRFENDRDGVNGWQNRRSLVLDVIRKYRPAIVGTQEGLPVQLCYLEENLKAYTLHAPLRVWDDTCQYSTFFIEKGSLEITGGDEFWLSETPQVHRSKSWDSGFPRMMSSANLKDRETGRQFTAIVTHLDHLGEEARLQQARILRRLVHEPADPVILMGDFNDGPGSPAHAVLAGRDSNLADSWELLKRPENKQSFTSHGFTGIPEKNRIDWILLTSQWTVKDARIVQEPFENRYPSDHFPYYVDLAWKNENSTGSVIENSGEERGSNPASR